MAVHYDKIRTASWLPVSPGAGHAARYRALPFPEEWRDAILALCNAGRAGDAEPYRTVPTLRFEQVLQAFAPDVLVMPRPYGQGGDVARWLYVPEDMPDPLPPPVFRTLVDRWLGSLRPEPEHRALLKDVRAQLAAAPPAWEPVEAELIACPTTSGGTAAPLGHQFTLSTDWLARRILALDPYEYAGGRLRFRAAPRGRRDQGAELISQPLPYETAKATWWYSVVLHITLHTVPFDPLPRFHLHCGIRRWATRVSATTGMLRLPFGRRSAVLLRPRVPYLPGAPRSERFALAYVERRWDRDERAPVVDWADGGPARILQGISLTERFPEADEILAAPSDWLTGDFRAGVVYSTAMGSHEVKAGLMSHQRSQLTEWAEQALPPQLRPAPALVRSRRANSKPLNAPPAVVKKEDKPQEATRRAAERRRSAAFAISCLRPPAPGTPPVLETRLLWQTPEMRDAMVTALIEYLGLKGGGGAFTDLQHADARPGAPVVLEWQAAELTVRLRCIRLTGGLADGLPLPEGRRTRSQVTAAVSARRAEVRSWLADEVIDDIPGLALVEIDRRADFASGEHDPKFALRLGFADAGMVTQFMTVPKQMGRYDSVKNMAHRASKAWDDGLRQLGVRVHPEHGLGDRLPDQLRYAAVWLIRKSRTARNRWAAHVPVAVLVTPQSGAGGLARVQGWDPEADGGAGAWIPYPAMLLRLTRLAEVPARPPAGTASEKPPSSNRGSRYRDMEEQRRAAEEWLQKIRLSLRGVPTVLLAHAQNARSHWTWLQDGRAEPDRIRDGHAPARALDDTLRLIRVRTIRGRETAQWWGLHPKEGPNGLAAHLWVAEGRTDSRVFYSTTPKPAQFKSSAVEADKLAIRPMKAGKRKGEPTIDIDKPGWTPGLVEIAVLGCHPGRDIRDDPESLAMAVHQFRQPPDYAEALSLPLPLHLAGLCQEYVLPIPREETEADTDEDRLPTSPDNVDEAADTDPDMSAAPGLSSPPDDED